MKRVLLTVFLAALAACAPPPPCAPCPSCPALAPPKPRLYANERGRLYIADVPAGFRRSALFYVYAAVPLPHTDTHELIAILQGANRYGNVLEGDWYCPPDGPVDEWLVKGGLPVEEVPQDNVARVKHCLGHYKPGTVAEWDDKQKRKESYVDLRLDLGKNDGVNEGDYYQVLGQPMFESVNHAITGFERVGECVVQPFEVMNLGAVCRLDRVVWGSFTREWFVQGGLVRRKPKEPPRAP